ncbi:MAG: glycine betaine/L-proline ABC transporter ATP-binding protein [Clostridia bacterium]
MVPSGDPKAEPISRSDGTEDIKPIRLEGLTKIFGPRQSRALEMLDKGADKDEIQQKTRATVGVNNVSFEVNEGEVFVVMGLSGSGKSTLVRCLNRLIKPTRGKVYIYGENVMDMDENRLRDLRLHTVSMVFQSFGLLPHLNVEENVAYGLRVRGVSREERLEQARKTLEAVGLGNWADSAIRELSGGMQQRVGLARALATNPKIMLMDEPFSALDPLIRREMQKELTDLQSELSKTIVFITHDLDEALQLGDRIAVMKDGLVHQIGTPEDILRNPATDYVAEFVEGVNPWGVIKAEHIMDHPQALAFEGDGPRTALRRMRLERLSSIFVVDHKRYLVGIITADAALKALDEDADDIGPYIERDIPTIDTEQTLEDLVPIGATTKYPLPVVNEDGRLLGVVVRSAILNGLTNQHGRSRRTEDILA